MSENEALEKYQSDESKEPDFFIDIDPATEAVLAHHGITIEGSKVVIKNKRPSSAAVTSWEYNYRKQYPGWQDWDHFDTSPYISGIVGIKLRLRPDDPRVIDFYQYDEHGKETHLEIDEGYVHTPFGELGLTKQEIETWREKYYAGQE